MMTPRIRVFLTTLKDLFRINPTITIRSFEILFSGQHIQIDLSISFQINLKPRNPTLQTTRHSLVLTFIVFNSGMRYYSQEVDIDIQQLSTACSFRCSLSILRYNFNKTNLAGILIAVLVSRDRLLLSEFIRERNKLVLSAQSRVRSYNLHVNSVMLYQLSYLGFIFKVYRIQKQLNQLHLHLLLYQQGKE